MIKESYWKLIKKTVAHREFQACINENHPANLSPATTTGLADAQTLPATNIYSELPKKSDYGVDASNAPVFITARFRSGSTLLWNIFRNIEGVHCYYEPLNEGICFDPEERVQRVDPTHKGVKDYWSEYNHLRNVEHLFSQKWSHTHLLMDQTSYDRNMKLYIQELIQQAKGRAILQFNRADFRLPWLKANFRGIPIVHLYRHPRDLWLSVSSKSATVPTTLTNHDFTQYNLFYTMEWARDLSRAFPFLNPGFKLHPYYYHYLIWKLSYLYGHTYSDISISYEDLTSQPEQVLHNLFESIHIDLEQIKNACKLVSPVGYGKWTQYADDKWFMDIEQECEEILNAYFHNFTNQ